MGGRFGRMGKFGQFAREMIRRAFPALATMAFAASVLAASVTGGFRAGSVSDGDFSLPVAGEMSALPVTRENRTIPVTDQSLPLPAAGGNATPPVSDRPVSAPNADQVSPVSPAPGFGFEIGPAVDLSSFPVDRDSGTAEEAARSWAGALAELPGYESWKNAGTKLTALGPGRHGWLVLVTAGRQTVGHMIVSAKPEGGFVLTGFGTGEPPPDLP